MNSNGYTGQIKGPFIANRELFDLILEQSINSSDYISHIGIQATPGTCVVIGGMNGENFESKEIEIGRTKIYEVSSDDTRITSIKFKNGADEDTIIDYHIL